LRGIQRREKSIRGKAISAGGGYSSKVCHGTIEGNASARFAALAGFGCVGEGQGRDGFTGRGLQITLRARLQAAQKARTIITGEHDLEPARKEGKQREKTMRVNVQDGTGS